MRMSRQTRGALAALGSLVAVAGLVLTAAAVAQASGGNNDHGKGGNNGSAHDKVTLCHWVPAHGGSFVVITVNVRGADGNPNMQGHAGHPNDIIPMPASGCPAGGVATSTPPAEATNTPAEATETPAATTTEGPVSSATPTEAAVTSATPTGTATGGAAATNTPAATSTNTPTGGAAAVATNTTSAGVAGEQVTPAAAVAGASELPSTGSGGSGGSGHTMPYLLLGLTMLASGGAIAGSAFFRRTRG